MSEQRSVRCMLLPMSSINLVVPNSAVAEIIGFSKPQRLEDSSDWFLGMVLWRGVYVPVISIEQLCAVDALHVGSRSRIGIIYNPEKDDILPYIGLHMQDIPRAYLAESDTMESGSDDGLSKYLLSRVDDDELARAIPDLDAITADLKPQISQEKIDSLSR
ncbi:MAG: chemotaxis protein CheW [Gammaproteobacteria bacterium]|nr:chemotaxis protein CheW [Gammaproteobacteria bacterium]